MKYLKLAEKVLNNYLLDRGDCIEILNCPGDEILELLQAAFLVRRQYFGKNVYLHVLINAKSGFCSEDCSYCSQSAVSKAEIEKYPLVEEEAIIEGAHTAREAKAKRYCIVSSGRSPDRKDVERISKAVKRIKEEVGIDICTSLGFVTEDEAKVLKGAGVDRYNHNLNASERYYKKICSTHGFQDRIQTLHNARKAGMELCCGALFGMGESKDDIIDLALALKEIGPDSIPINFLHPIPGTPLEGVKRLTPLNCLTILCLARFVNPKTEIRVAGGMEYHLRSIQPLAFYPANSLFVNGYLTTMGQTAGEARKMVEDMGFEIEEERSFEMFTNQQSK